MSQTGAEAESVSAASARKVRFGAGSKMAPKGILRQPPVSFDHAPFMVIWEITRACDLSCVHCRAQAEPAGLPNQLAPEEGEALLKTISTFGTPRSLVILTGGDPFKRSDVFHLVKYGRDLGLTMAVSPAGTPLLTRENLTRLKKAGAGSISLSLDASTLDAHDAFRGVPGVFEKTLAGWDVCNSIVLPVQINTTVNRRNLLDLPNIFRLVQSKGAMTWSLFFLVPMGRAKKTDDLTGQQYEDAMNFLYDCSKYVSAKHTEGHHFKRVVLQRMAAERGEPKLGEPPAVGPAYLKLRSDLDRIVEEAHIKPKKDGVVRPPLNINAGKGFVFISSTGDVFPSGFLPMRVGNVRRESLVDLYRDHPTFRDLRNPDKLKGKCGQCNFRQWCGGSRSRSFAYTGDPFAAEPRCIYQPPAAS
ncbi:MAG: TIGR04053 family radical SAM/SPASM domain-containing protein [Nitrospirae bacterium]|nr:TIGR04053 family radical SAM/SPASM domain-containing protein [Nitrospirota bacterium]